MRHSAASPINVAIKFLNHVIERPAGDLRKLFARSKTGRKKSTNRWLVVARLPLSIVLAALALIAKLFLSPFEILFGKTTKKLQWSALLAVPILTLAAAFSGYGFLNQAHLQQIKQARASLKSLLATGDHPAAIQQFETLKQLTPALTDVDNYQGAQAYAGAAQNDQANNLLDKLAPGPDGVLGYPPAHQLAAVSIVRKHADQASHLPQPVQQLLKWHLEAGGESDAPEIKFAWANYWLSAGQPNAAIPPMTAAAKASPELLLLLANLHRLADHPTKEKETLDRAAAIFGTKLANNSDDDRTRGSLVSVLTELGQFETAERCLSEGVGLNPRKFKPLLSDFYLDRARAFAESADVDSELRTLRKSWQAHPCNVATFESVVGLYRKSNERQRKSIINALEIAESAHTSSPMPSFAIGIICRLENQMQDSQAAIERAYQRLNPSSTSFAVVANNLAWLLANDDQPDLEQALRLSQLAVQQRPNSGGLRDTLATVLMKQKRYDIALAEFQRALPTVKNKSAVHLKMAKIYDELKQPQLATLHRDRATVN